MKTLYYTRCSECGTPLLVEVEPKSLAQGRELQEWIVKNLLVCGKVWCRVVLAVKPHPFPYVKPHKTECEW